MAGAASTGDIDGNTCRCCLLASAKILSVFTTDRKQLVSYAEMMNVCCSLHLIENDGKPSLICSKCKKKLKSAYEFRKMCLQANSVLTDGVMVKIEKLDLSLKSEIKDVTQDKILNKKYDICATNVGAGNELVSNYEACKVECETEDAYVDLDVDFETKDDLATNENFNKPKEDSIGLLKSFKKQKTTKKKPNKTSRETKKTKRELTTGSKRVCNICNKFFQSTTLLKEHVDWVHKGIKYYCELCKKCYTSEYTHKKLSHGKGRECKECSIMFSTRMQWHMHMNKQHRFKDGTSCGKCGEKFNSQGELKKHRQVVHSKNVFFCDFCSKAFNRKDHMGQHIKVHMKDQYPHHCNMCTQKFSTYSQLQKHKLVHPERKTRARSAVKKTVCNICNKHCLSSRLLREHIEWIHRGVKSYFCELCKKYYTSESKHKTQKHNTGTGKQCHLCGEYLERSADWPTHMYNKHRDLAPTTFPCSDCDATFTCKSTLYNHRYSTHSQNTTMCQYCSKIFKSKEILDRHIKTHTNERPFACDMCTLTFITVSELNRHKLRHTAERNIKCDQCDAMFRTNGDLRKHATRHDPKYLPYPCGVCGKLFRRSDHRNTHQRLVHKLEPVKMEMSAQTLVPGLENKLQSIL